LAARLAALALAAALGDVAVAKEGEAEGNPHLVEALGHIENGDLDGARKALDAAMAHPENTNRELVQIYANLAVVHLYAGEENRAYEAYVRLLNIDPHFRLPAHAATPLQALFERVLTAYEDGHIRPVRVAHDPPERTVAGIPAVITATVSNLPDQFAAHLHYRTAGDPAYERLRLASRPGSRWVATLPDLAPEPEAGDVVVEYYVEVVNEAGHRVQGSGNAREPHRLHIGTALSPEPPAVAPAPAWYQRPWVWGVVGGVAAGSAAAIYLGTRGADAGTLPVRVRVQEPEQ
jgi:Tfp pilus assembly protein PilF